MNKKCCLRPGLKASQPAEQLFRVGMITELLQSSYLRADGHFVRENLHRTGPVLDDIPARARRLKTDEDYLIARIGKPLCQMVQHPSACDHAAGGYDDAGILYLVDLAGIFLLGSEVKALPLQ